MKGNESQRNPGANILSVPSPVVHLRQHHSGSYQKVHDERKQPIRGLWVRNGRYYAQVTLEDPTTGAKRVRRVPLVKATTPAQAKSALNELLVQRNKGQAIVQHRAPTFAAFAKNYLDYHKEAKDTKRASTMETEGYAIDRLKEHLGHFNLDKIKRIHLDSFISKRQQAGVSARTVNLEITVLRNVLNRALDHKLISCLPTDNLRPLKSIKPKRGLATREDVERLCAVPFQPVFHDGRLARPGERGTALLNAQQFVDYIKLMCYCGSRMSETLRLRWSDVDWKQRQLTIGADGLTKNGKSRSVEFNDDLETHLQAMDARRTPRSQWLFPSPRSGKIDRPAKTFRECLLLARTAAGLPKFAFHDCRHFFISYSVMAGIDFMTIAKWVGHQDGGILIATVYGHLSNEHAQRQAKKLSLRSGRE